MCIRDRTETERQRERQRDRHIYIDRQTGIYREIERQTDRQTDRQREMSFVLLVPEKGFAACVVAVVHAKRKNGLYDTLPPRSGFPLHFTG